MALQPADAQSQPQIFKVIEDDFRVVFVIFMFSSGSISGIFTRDSACELVSFRAPLFLSPSKILGFSA
jgi:hypothetical protein